jgi:hypothetical protein
MAFQQILSLNGPLPIKQSFTIEVDGPVDFFITSTAYIQTPNFPVGVEVAINGVPLGSSNLFANQPQVHMTLPTIFGTAQISDPTVPQVLTIDPTYGSTMTDSNDFFNVWVQY